jgi:hypothetical protein
MRERRKSKDCKAVSMQATQTRRAILAIFWLGSALAAPAHAEEFSMFAAENPQSLITIDHTAWGEILSRYLIVNPISINRFDYRRITPADRAKLQSYLARLQTVNPATLAAAEQHAYWINFYNSLTVEVILEHYPVQSIRDISSGWFKPGPWDLKLVTVKGQKLSLNNIEHDILRKYWKEPRVHYALNCASLGCPDLAVRSYSGSALDAELDAAARAFVNHPRGVYLKNDRLILSSIYDWYRKDFNGGTDGAIIASVRKYADPQLAVQLGHQSLISGYQYDWRLNAPGANFDVPH